MDSLVDNYIVEVIYDTSPGTTTRVAREGLLLEGLTLSTLE
jgi:hypothetical protein